MVRAIGHKILRYPSGLIPPISFQSSPFLSIAAVTESRRGLVPDLSPALASHHSTVPLPHRLGLPTRLGLAVAHGPPADVSNRRSAELGFELPFVGFFGSERFTDREPVHHRR